jgi:arginyl-tRNA synthetase
VLDEKNSELTRARLNLVNAVRIVLAETLDLMGISAPEKM